MPDIRHATIPIALLDPHESNYNKHPAAQLERIALSLRRFRQPRSVVVWERPTGRYTIIAGHGVTAAARQEGWTELRCDILPVDYSEQDALGFVIADNELSHLADPDQLALAQLLQEQANAGYDLASLGSSDEELAALLESLADDKLSEDADPPDFKDYDETIEDDLPTEMCQQCGKLCLKPGAKAKS